MKKRLASIDIGTHTSRLLVAECSEAKREFRPLTRKREYLSLADHLDGSGKKLIEEKGITRILEVLKGFLNLSMDYGVEEVRASATCLIREARNREVLLNRIFEATGLRVRVLTEEKEAYLTGKGVSYALDIREGPFVIFDLGGGSTEFVVGKDPAKEFLFSIPLGAAILSKEYIGSDPPTHQEIQSLEGHIDRKVEPVCSELLSLTGRTPLIVGTGGTAVALAAMLKGIPVESLFPEQINGMVVKKTELELLFEDIKEMDFEERSTLSGLDRGRAGIIVPGALLVIRILKHFGSSEMRVSMSDILEGLLMDDSKRPR